MSLTWSRRGLLSAAAALPLAACDSAGPSPAASPRTSSSAASGTPWSQLRRHLDGALVRPGDRGFNRLRLTPNPRYDAARPLALVEAASDDDVATALGFAADHDLPLALRSGGHCYAGWSAGAGRLVVDSRRMTQATWSGTRLTIGAGTTLASLYETLAARGRALPGGSCPTVGATGLTLGGGVGVLTRPYGLTCDHLVGASVVLASGRVVRVDAASEPALFWALRGGGGGHLGVVTSLTYDTVAAPTLVSTYLTWPLAKLADVVPAWCAWIRDADPRLWSTLKTLASPPDAPTIGATVTWVGPASSFDRALAPLLATGPSGRFDHTRSFLDAMQAYAGSGAREAFAATSHIAYEPLDADAVATIAEQINRVPTSLIQAGISIDALGGRVSDVAAADSAFVHRAALATVQYTATYSGGSARPAASYVRGFRDAMTPHLGDHAYVNYADASLHDPGTAYFGSNWPRLQSVRATYDPDGLFTQPQ